MSTAARDYLVVTLAYWSFTITDGALRMIVLLHFHELGYSPMQLATLFLLYEMCGVVTNLFGGWLGAERGLRWTLLLGLALQGVSLLAMSANAPGWSTLTQWVYITLIQGLSGVAKDLTKLSAKSAIKVLVPDADGALFRWVAFLTGSKNTLKGAGFFVGSALLMAVGFAPALWCLAGLVFSALVLATSVLPGDLGLAKGSVPLSGLMAKSRTINLLSGARFFLFGARDVWFAVGLPVFLSDALGWSFVQVGTYLALWVIGYGVVQAVTPGILGLRPGVRRSARDAWMGAAVLACVPLLLTVGLWTGLPEGPVVVGGLALFGAVFAVNSAVHSYLILAYSDHLSVSADVGYYYMANAGGRLMGTLLSGMAYGLGGLSACLGVASAMLIASAILAYPLPEPLPASGLAQ